MNLGLFEWALPRQRRAGGLLGRGRAARSAASAGTIPRTFGAGRVVKSVCPYCAVGCGQNVHVKGGEVVAGAALLDEESHLVEKLCTALGIVRTGSRRLLPRGSAATGLAASSGGDRGSARLRDLNNSDCVLVEGSDFAETHPVGFQWVTEAKARGATVVHVDPRFTRTSALSDLFVPLRVGTDAAFLGGIVDHVLTRDAWFRDYVLEYTDASSIVGEGSGATDGPTRAGAPATDESLGDPRCVLNVLRRRFARCTHEMVERVCGIPAPLFERVCVTVCQASGPDRTTAFVHGDGWSEHRDGSGPGWDGGTVHQVCVAGARGLVDPSGQAAGGLVDIRPGRGQRPERAREAAGAARQGAGRPGTAAEAMP